jgi:RNA polymerase sigma-70 factor (ECF subfamily)
MTREPLPPTSPTLLGRLRGTDEAAWRDFVKRYGPQIYRWCRRWGLREEDAQEVAQVVLVKLAEKMRSFDYDPTRSFRAYLKTLTRYAWCDFLTARQRPDVADGGSQVFDRLHSIEARDDLVVRLEEEFDRELLEEAMARVRLRVAPHTWEAFRLTALEGLPGAEASARLDMEVATVFKAKSKVQKMLQDEVSALETVT